MSGDDIQPSHFDDALTPGFDIQRPDVLGSPVIFASPHSGRRYPVDFLKASRLDNRAIRRSEDAFVDELFAAAPEFGAPLLRAHFPRAYVDVNREPYELDPGMFNAALPGWVNTTSPRVGAGLGTVAKIVAGGAEIYDRRLDFEDAVQRIETHYKPYHAALQGLIDEALDAFGRCLIVDCHSMPSMALPSANTSFGNPDIVLGDCHGSSCVREITHIAEQTLRDLGLSVQRNKPYAGGFTTRHYARHHAGVQTLQIEINRALYMDEVHIRRTAGFDRLAERMRLLIARLSDLASDVLAPPLAAE
ncbi:N-formylglutamate amidohydrolase [Thalassospiraceae bacterium LMO-JJ14]|nr:N-formylglutamate amidohydrolase [Thalassospiraceae bacterium LMO-JJ14]